MKPEEVRERVHRYVVAYYDELRKQMDAYKTMPDAFPAYLKGCKRVVAVLGQDGVVVSHWPAEMDAFEFHQSDKAIGEIANEQSDGGFQWDIEPGAEVGMKAAGVAIYLGTEASGTPHWRTPWDVMHVTSDVSGIQWNDTLVRTEATNDVLTFVTGHLLNLNSDTKPPQIFDRLETVINEFGALLRSHPGEEEVQRFLKENPSLLSQGAVAVRPKVPLGAEHVTDFVIERDEHEYILVEIERPEFPLFTRQGDPTAKLTHSMRQVEDWLDWISDNKDYAQRHILPEVSEPEAWVIIGLRSRMDKKSKKALARKNRELNRIKIRTFDDLTSEAKSYLNNLRRI